MLKRAGPRMQKKVTVKMRDKGESEEEQSIQEGSTFEQRTRSWKREKKNVCEQFCGRWEPGREYEVEIDQ